jgi:hypothetical protein
MALLVSVKQLLPLHLASMVPSFPIASQFLLRLLVFLLQVPWIFLETSSRVALLRDQWLHQSLRAAPLEPISPTNVSSLLLCLPFQDLLRLRAAHRKHLARLFTHLLLRLAEVKTWDHLPFLLLKL